MTIKVQDEIGAKGYVEWEIIDDKTGKIKRSGRGYPNKWYFRISFIRQILDKIPWMHYSIDNAILDTARSLMGDWLIGTVVTVPQYIGIGTGSTAVASSDIALDTPIDYDGANEAKIADSRSKKGQFTARLITQFLVAEANQSITELGLFDAANSGTLWARVLTTITKTSSERLNIYWYITFERRATLAIKTGASIGATGTLTQDTDSTATFASTVTSVMIQNNSGSDAYFSLNDAIAGAGTPTDYDFVLADGEHREYNQEEFSIDTVHVIIKAAGPFALPNNNIVIRGW